MNCTPCSGAWHDGRGHTQPSGTLQDRSVGLVTHDQRYIDMIRLGKVADDVFTIGAVARGENSYVNHESPITFLFPGLFLPDSPC